MFWQTVDAAFYLLQGVTGPLLLLPFVTPGRNCCEAKTLICGSFKCRVVGLYVKTLSFWVLVFLNLPAVQHFAAPPQYLTSCDWNLQQTTGLIQSLYFQEQF